MFECKNIKKSFDRKIFLEDVNLSVNQNELVCVLGASGVGKSTLFNILSGIMPPDSGNILLNKEDITGKSGYVSYMQQKDLLFPFKTVLENVILPKTLKKELKKSASLQALGFFEKFGLAGYEHKYPHQLSGGMRQRAALLRTYLCDNEIMLLDEPFSALDAMTKSSMHEWFLEIHRTMKLTSLFITHDIDEAIKISDRILIISGSPANITDEILINKTNKPADFELTPEFLEIKKQILKSNLARSQ